MVKRDWYLVLVTRASGCDAWLSDSCDETTERAVSIMEKTIARAEEFTGCYIIGCSCATFHTDVTEDNPVCRFSHDGDVMLQSSYDPIAGAVTVQTVEAKPRIDKVAHKWLKIYLKKIKNEGKNKSED